MKKILLAYALFIIPLFGTSQDRVDAKSIEFSQKSAINIEKFATYWWQDNDGKWHHKNAYDPKWGFPSEANIRSMMIGIIDIAGEERIIISRTFLIPGYKYPNLEVGEYFFHHHQIAEITRESFNALRNINMGEVIKVEVIDNMIKEMYPNLDYSIKYSESATLKQFLSNKNYQSGLIFIIAKRLTSNGKDVVRFVLNPTKPEEFFTDKYFEISKKKFDDFMTLK